MSKAKFQEARDLIDSGRYDAAASLLGDIDHPKAREWEDKIAQLRQANGQPQRPTSGNGDASPRSTLSYPLRMSFKILALAPRIFLHDADDREVIYVHQKVLALKEDVRIFTNSSKDEEIYRIKADRIVDWSANYHFTESQTGRKLGSIKRKGWRSIWRATYVIFDENERQTHFIREDNLMVRMADHLMTMVPFLGMLAGYFFHPSFTAYRGTDREDVSRPAMRLKKRPSFFERAFEIEQVDANLPPTEEQRLLLSFLMLVQLERGRG